MAPTYHRATRPENPVQQWLWPLYVPDPDFYTGIHPTQYCLSRLRWAEHEALPQLLSAVHMGICPRPLYEAAVRRHSEFVTEFRHSVALAAAWELERYGCLL